MTLQDLYDDVDFLCGSNSVTYPTATKLRNINLHYSQVAAKIWEAAGSWQYDDSNATDFGIATTDIVANQQDYELPSTCQRLERVELNGVLIPQQDLHDIDVATSQESGQFYDVTGRSIFLYPIPSTSITSGLKVFFNRDVTALSAVSDVPGFATPYHRILSLGTSLDFSRNENDRKAWITDKAILENSMKRFYGKRNVEGKTIIKPAGKKRWRNYT